MAEVKVLIEGYAREMKMGWIASSTVTLVMANNKNIIIDPGCNRNKLIKALIEENLNTGDISFVLLTHNHTDHALLAGIFENAKVLTPVEIYNNDRQTEYDSKVLGNGLEIIPTPGHCSEHCSLVVLTKNGIYVIAGDVFWWTDNEKQKVDINKKDQAHPEEANMKKLIASRKKILKMADYIIPGHGEIFKAKN